MITEGHGVRLLTRNGSLKYVSEAEVNENAYRENVLGRSHEFYVSLGEYDRGNERLIMGEYMPALRAKLMEESQWRPTHRSSESARRGKGPARVTRKAPKARA